MYQDFFLLLFQFQALVVSSFVEQDYLEAAKRDLLDAPGSGDVKHFLDASQAAALIVIAEELKKLNIYLRKR